MGDILKLMRDGVGGGGAGHRTVVGCVGAILKLMRGMGGRGGGASHRTVVGDILKLMRGIGGRPQDSSWVGGRHPEVNMRGGGGKGQLQ